MLLGPDATQETALEGIRKAATWPESVYHSRSGQVAARISFSAHNPRHFYHAGSLKSEHKLATYMSALAQLVGLSHVFEWENGIEMGFELTDIGQFRHFGHLLT